MATLRIPALFIHGLWIHGAAWQPWVDLFRESGYDPIAPGWPGDSPGVAQTRANPAALAGVGIDDITTHYARIVDDLPAPPVVIGHSFGGLIAQKLLTLRPIPAAAAIDPAPIKGIRALPFSQLRAGFPVLGNPRNAGRVVALTAKQFRYGFGNAIPEAESDDLHARWAIPGPGRPLFEAATANLRPSSPAKIDTRLDSRGPLLIVSGGRDHTVPDVVSRAAFKLYQGSAAKTEFAQFPDRGHSLVIDHGWQEVAEHVRDWLARQNLAAGLGQQA